MEDYNTRELATCPTCSARKRNVLCTLGNDEDGMITCPVCGRTFRPKSTISMTDMEFSALKQVSKSYERTGWTAYEIMTEETK